MDELIYESVLLSPGESAVVGPAIRVTNDSDHLMEVRCTDDGKIWVDHLAPTMRFGE
jgi:hypothetical protein